MPGTLLVNGIESDNENLEFDCIGAGKTIKFKRNGVEVASIGDGGISGLPEDTQLCKAWVNFNGIGTVSIRDSFNVSSITDNGTGRYVVNFANAMVTANYVVAGTCHEFENNYDANSYFMGRTYHNINYVMINTSYDNGVLYDMYTDVMVFGA